MMAGECHPSCRTMVHYSFVGLYSTLHDTLILGEVVWQGGGALRNMALGQQSESGPGRTYVCP